jgi:hypothetical protein
MMRASAMALPMPDSGVKTLIVQFLSQLFVEKQLSDASSGRLKSLPRMGYSLP